MPNPFQQWGEFFQELGQVMAKAPNPFETNVSENSKDDKERAKRLKEFAGFFLQRAQDLRTKVEIAELFDCEEGHEWLMDKIDEKLDIEEWSQKDTAELGALFFLMTLPPDQEEED